MKPLIGTLVRLLLMMLLAMAINIGGCNGGSSFHDVCGNLRLHDRELVTRELSSLMATIAKANEHLGRKVLLEANIEEALCSMAFHGDFPRPQPLPSVFDDYHGV
jgi:hypothetical protein